MSASPIVRTWDSDKLYLEDQDGDSSWSHSSIWGENAAGKFMAYGDTLKNRRWFYHDDVVADFGGNDGFAAHQFYLRHGIKPLVIDCAANRLEFAAQNYRLKTVQCFLEDIPLPRACAFIVPLEKPDQAKLNRAHSVGCPSVIAWIRLMRRNNWIIKGSACTMGRTEGQIFALPRGHK
ncbi:MAG: hypothetical protein ACYTEQ_28030 [Planctomycetota bacterium]|jgi:hypothetical protein